MSVPILRPPPPPAPRRSLSDGQAVVLAVAIAVGAYAGKPVPLLLAVAVIAAAFAFRRPWLLCIGGLALASALSARSMAGLRPAAVASYRGPAVLVTDPAPVPGGRSALVRVGQHRYELTARGHALGDLPQTLAGETVALEGTIRPPPPNDSWRLSRHVVGELDASSVMRTSAGSPIWRLANAFRRTLEGGAVALPLDQRALFDGFVLGDNRDESPLTADDFRASGLTHLLVVSGENVAFVLTLAGPVLRRLALRPRWLATIAVILLFAAVTRFEPSVLRASAMAMLAATAALAGRPVSSVRLLSLGAAALLLVDPMLVYSVGFALSVAACLGIVLVSGRLAAAIPGPRALAQAVGVTVGAQLGVAPLQLMLFGGLPVASIPANLLAAPAAAAVMVWGVGAGLVVGVVGIGVGWLHWPTRVMVEWIQSVARWSADLPLGQLGWWGVGLLAAGAMGIVVGQRVARRSVSAAGWLAALLALSLPAMTYSSAVPVGLSAPTRGAQLWRSGPASVLVIDGTVKEAPLLAALRLGAVHRLDAVVARSSGRATARLLADLRQRCRIDRLYAPSNGAAANAITPAVGDRAQVGPFVLTFPAVTPRLTVTVTNTE